MQLFQLQTEVNLNCGYFGYLETTALKLKKYECTMDQELKPELLAGNQRMLLLHAAAGTVCTHQMAALFCMK